MLTLPFLGAVSLRAFVVDSGFGTHAFDYYGHFTLITLEINSIEKRKRNAFKHLYRS